MNFGKYIWQNGEFLPAKDAQISVINHALHYGSGVFEGVRAYRTSRGMAIFRAREHTERLFFSASKLELEIPFTPEQIERAQIELLAKNNFDADSVYLRPIAFFGENKMGLNPSGASIEVVIAAWPWGKYLSDDPISVGTSPWIRIHPHSLPCDAKISGHYVNSILSSLWAKKKNFTEALLLDYEGNLAEGPGENLFLVKDGEIFTPQKGSILPGITRDSVFQIAKNELGISVVEKTLKKEDLLAADEAFFTGTAAEVTLIDSLDGVKIGNDRPISEKIKSIYARIVRGDFGGKYEDWLSLV